VYKQKAWSVTPAQKKDPQLAQQLERTHAQEQERLEKAFDHTKVLLAKIARNEKGRSTSDEQVTEAEVVQSLQEKSEERRAIRDERLAKWDKDAEEDREYKRAVKESLDGIRKDLHETVELEKQLFGAIQEYMEFKREFKQRKLNDSSVQK